MLCILQLHLSLSLFLSSFSTLFPSSGNTFIHEKWVEQNFFKCPLLQEKKEKKRKREGGNVRERERAVQQKPESRRTKQATKNVNWPCSRLQPSVITRHSLRRRLNDGHFYTVITSDNKSRIYPEGYRYNSMFLDRE